MDLRLAPPARDRCPFDFVAIGEGGVDVLSVVDSLPEFETKTQATRRSVMAGGQAATAAVGASRLGCRARWIGVTGDDDWGRTLRSTLHTDSVDVLAPVRQGVGTRSATVFVDRVSGRRAIVEARDAALDMNENELAQADFCTGRLVLVDGTDTNLSLRAARAARNAGCRTMVDLDHMHSGAMALLREIDIVVLPDKLVRELSGNQGLRGLARQLPQAAAIIATLGPDGAHALCDGREARVAALRGHAVDTTGAGDAFRAGFAARWLAGGSTNFLDLLEYAALVAGLSCRAVGAQSGLPTATEVEAAWCNRPPASWV